MAAPPIRVVLVEDDHDLRQGLAEYLRLCGFDVVDVATGLAFYRALRSGDFDIAILDVNLPDTSGFELARDLSAEGRMGLILLTARTGRDDRMRGYAEGADLYLTKPVEGEELALVVRNLARRLGEAGAPSHAEESGSGRDVWRIDTLRQLLLPPKGDPIQLSGRELMLFDLLAKAEGGTVARSTLALHLGYDVSGPESRSFDAVLRRLRQKASDRGLSLPIQAIHARGLRLSAPFEVS